MHNTKRRVVYTCITGNYDEVPLRKPKGDFEFICFVDDETMTRNRNIINTITDVEFRIAPSFGSAEDTNRFIKIRPHEALREYDESIYIDGNVRMRQDPFALFEGIPADKPVALYRQPDRDCAYRELDELVRVGVAKGSSATRVKLAMKSLGMNDSSGLFEANIIFRAHNTSSCKVLMTIWWSLWESALVKRDQPLLAFANYLTGNSIIHSLGFSDLRIGNNAYFYYEGRIHKKPRIQRLVRRIASELCLYRRG